MQSAWEQNEGLPDDLNEFAHVYVVWHQELGLVQHGKLLLSFIPLNDHLQREDSQDQPSR